MQSIFDQMKLLIRTPISPTRDSEEGPATALQSSALRRCTSLSIYLESLDKPLHQLPTNDLDTMTTLDEAMKNMSDENFLAILRIVPPHHLRYQLDITRAARTPLADVAYSVYETHFALAVSGYELGLSYGESQEERSRQRISKWVHMLFVSASEDSVSFYELLACERAKSASRNCLAERQQSIPYKGSLMECGMVRVIQDQSLRCWVPT